MSLPEYENAFVPMPRAAEEVFQPVDDRLGGDVTEIVCGVHVENLVDDVRMIRD